MFKKSYPASVLSAVLAIIAAKQSSLRTGNHLSVPPSFPREPDAEYEVMLTSENKDEILIRTYPKEQYRTRLERNLKRWRQEAHDLRPALNERIDPKDPRADIRTAAKRAAEKTRDELSVAIRTAELQLLDISEPTEDRYPLAALAAFDLWTVAPEGVEQLPVQPTKPAPEPVEQADPMDVVVEDAYRSLAKVALPEGSPALAPWEAADTETVRGLLAEIQALAENPDDTPEKRHAEWVTKQMEAGWTYGPEEDAEGKKNPLIVDYVQLPDFVKERDQVIAAAAQAARKALGLVVEEVPAEVKPEAPKANARKTTTKPVTGKKPDRKGK